MKNGVSKKQTSRAKGANSGKQQFNGNTPATKAEEL